MGYGGYSGLYGKREADSEPKADADAYTFGQIAYGLPQAMPTPPATPTMSVSSLELTTDMAVSLAMELSVTVAMLAMEDTLDTVVSMVATVASMASVRPILSPRQMLTLTPSARSPTVSPRPMPTPPATPTMSVSSLELTTDMAVSLAME